LNKKVVQRNRANAEPIVGDGTFKRHRAKKRKISVRVKGANDNVLYAKGLGKWENGRRGSNTESRPSPGGGKLSNG